MRRWLARRRWKQAVRMAREELALYDRILPKVHGERWRAALVERKIARGEYERVLRACP